MTIDYDKLTNWKFDEIEQTYTCIVDWQMTWPSAAALHVRQAAMDSINASLDGTTEERSAFLTAFQPSQMAAVAASAAASAATATVQANNDKDKDKDNSKGNDKDETAPRPWTEGDRPAFEVDGLHPHELRPLAWGKHQSNLELQKYAVE